MENNVNPAHRNVSLVPSTGSTSALAIAFNDLKRRYLLHQSELSNVKLQNQKMNSQLQQSVNTTHIFERKVDQLQKSLKSKITAYNNLEETYKQTRQHEDSLIAHSSETERMLEDSLLKMKHVQDQSELFRKENQKLHHKIECLEKEKEQLQHKLHEINRIPEVKISKHEIYLPKGAAGKYIFDNGTDFQLQEEFQAQHDRQAKRIKDLVAENKNLRTNVHWLCEELKETKEQKPPKRIRRDSDSLEEGKKASNTELPALENLQVNTTCLTGTKSNKTFALYIEKLHKTIQTLRKSLESNQGALDVLILNKYRSNTSPPSKTCICTNTDYNKKYNEKHIEKPDQMEVMEAGHSNTNSIILPENIPICEKLEMHKMLYPSMWRSHDSREPHSSQVRLPPSLLHSVKLQQTQTYLTSKTFLQQVPQIHQRMPAIYNANYSLDNNVRGPNTETQVTYVDNKSNPEEVIANIHLNKVSLYNEHDNPSGEIP